MRELRSTADQTGQAVVGSHPLKCEKGHDAVALVWSNGRVEVACPVCGRSELSGRAGRPEEARASPSLEDTQPLPPLDVGRSFAGSRETVMKRLKPGAGVWLAIVVLLAWYFIYIPFLRSHLEPQLSAETQLAKWTEEFRSQSKPKSTEPTIKEQTDTNQPEQREPAIWGSPEFTRRVRQALELLERKDPEGYDRVCQYTRVISETEEAFMPTLPSPAGIKAFAWAAPNNEIAIGPTWPQYDARTLAAALVHEATHQMPEVSTIGLTNPREEERICFRRENKTRAKLGLPQWDIEETLRTYYSDLPSAPHH